MMKGSIHFFFNIKWMGLVLYISTKSEFELTKVGLIPSEKQHSISFINSLWSESKIRISRRMGAVRITSLYPKFNGSHFCLPPSSIHKIGRFCKRISVRFSERSSCRDFGRYGNHGIEGYNACKYRKYRTGRNLTRKSYRNSFWKTSLMTALGCEIARTMTYVHRSQ